MPNKNNSGFAQLLVLIVLFAAVAAIVVLVLSKPQAKQYSNVFNNTYTPAPTVLKGAGLEAELNSVPLADPSEDFTEVDNDITSL